MIISTFDLPITFEDLLCKTTERDIFIRYVNRDPESLSGAFRSPFRKDSTPSCGFYINNKGRYVLHDLSSGEKLDCVGVVQKIYNENYNSALNRINRELGLNVTPVNSGEYNTSVVRAPKPSAQILVEIKKFLPEELNFWKEFGITVNTLKEYRVFSVDRVFLNGNLILNHPKMTFCYWFPENNTYKVYQPYNKEHKFIGNFDASLLQGWVQVKTQLKQNLDRSIPFIITSSLKDVMVLREMGFYAVAPHAEGYHIKEDYIAGIQNLGLEVVLNYDSDESGLKNSIKRSSEFGIKYFFLNEAANCKDPSDHVKVLGIEKTKKIILNKISALYD